ncbi:MAG: hypoxanthine phosphoribosyltransferase [Oscillospiraceae bacterium]|nr:hypoxanthine phosphoribosyltransferase [Oscillospiraceae bacterium]
MLNDIKEVLISEEELKATVKELAAQVNRDYAGKNVLLVSILKGAVVFMADFMRELDLKCEIEFMVVSSYGSGVRTSGNVKIIKDLDVPIEGRDVIIVEDILDSGVTLSNLLKMLEERHPASMEICTLLDKPARRQAEVYAKYIGRQIPDAFVVGYGLDYDEKYRNLPFVGILKPEVYSE